MYHLLPQSLHLIQPPDVVSQIPGLPWARIVFSARIAHRGFYEPRQGPWSSLVLWDSHPRDSSRVLSLRISNPTMDPLWCWFLRFRTGVAVLRLKHKPWFRILNCRPNDLRISEQLRLWLMLRQGRLCLGTVHRVPVQSSSVDDQAIHGRYSSNWDLSWSSCYIRVILVLKK